MSTNQMPQCMLAFLQRIRSATKRMAAAGIPLASNQVGVAPACLRSSLLPLCTTSSATTPVHLLACMGGHSALHRPCTMSHECMKPHSKSPPTHNQTFPPTRNQAFAHPLQNAHKLAAVLCLLPTRRSNIP